jgi:transcriptional regulator with XRE-family HTH domain
VRNNRKKDPRNKLLGRRLQQLRETSGLKQEQLAESVGISPRHFQRYESGETPMHATLVIDIAKALKLDPATLLVLPTDVSGARRGRPRNR